MRSPGTKSAHFLRAIENKKIIYKETEIVRFNESGIELRDGSVFPCDVVVCCTGYTNENTLLPKDMKGKGNKPRHEIS